MSPPSPLNTLGERPLYLDEAWHSPKGKAIREVIYGATDGLVSSLGFVIGVFGALAQARIILITGIAEATAGALSMGFSAYISSKSQAEFFLAEIGREEREIRETPEKERDEVRKIYAKKGFRGQELEMVVQKITSDPKVWLRCMMEEELGLIVESFDTPWAVGVITAASYLAAAFLPILPFAFVAPGQALSLALGISIATLFVLGAGKTRLTKTPPVKSGLELVTIGAIAALVGYAVGLAAGRLL